MASVTTDRQHSGRSDLGDGAIVERLIRMRAACHALATELANARRQLRSVEAELRREKQRAGRRSKS
jgi:hypothetical protein